MSELILNANAHLTYANFTYLSQVFCVAMLSPPDDFTGGGFVYRNVETGVDTVLSLEFGDVVVCPSEMEHMVKPLVSGTRISMNIDFWLCLESRSRPILCLILCKANEYLLQSRLT